MIRIDVKTFNCDFNKILQQEQDNIQKALADTAQAVLDKSVEDGVIPYLSGDLQNQIITRGVSEVANENGVYSCYISAEGPHVARLWFGQDNRAPKYVIGNDKGYTHTVNKNAKDRWWNDYDDYAQEQMIENLKRGK